MSEEIIAVIGGTGNLGAALARKLAQAGRRVIIGSSAAESAEKAAAELGHGLTGLSNQDAAAAAAIIIVTVPFAAQEATLASIKPFIEGKIIVDTTVPLMPPKVMRVQLPAEGSAAQRAQMLLGEGRHIPGSQLQLLAHPFPEL